MELTYQTRELPTECSSSSRRRPARSPPRASYTYRELPAGLGEMEFFIAGTQTIAGGLPEDLRIRTRWSPGSGGEGRVTLERGDAPGATQREC